MMTVNTSRYANLEGGDLDAARERAAGDGRGGEEGKGRGRLMDWRSWRGGTKRGCANIIEKHFKVWSNTVWEVGHGRLNVN